MNIWFQVPINKEMRVSFSLMWGSKEILILICNTQTEEKEKCENVLYSVTNWEHVKIFLGPYVTNKTNRQMLSFFRYFSSFPHHFVNWQFLEVHEKRDTISQRVLITPQIIYTFLYPHIQSPTIQGSNSNPQKITLKIFS